MCPSQEKGLDFAMGPDAPRRFTLIDAMALVAATALSLVLIRDYVEDRRIAAALRASLPADWGIADLWRRGTVYAGIVSPLAVALSLALFVLRVQEAASELAADVPAAGNACLLGDRDRDKHLCREGLGRRVVSLSNGDVDATAAALALDDAAPLEWRSRGGRLDLVVGQRVVAFRAELDRSRRQSARCLLDRQRRFLRLRVAVLSGAVFTDAGRLRER